VLRRLSPPAGTVSSFIGSVPRKSLLGSSIRAGLISRRNFRRAEGFISSDQIEILRGTL